MSHQQYTQAACDIARMAGGMILSRMGTALDIQSKTQKHDYVTEVDRDAEKIIRDAIMQKFPGSRFYGEELSSLDPAQAADTLSSQTGDDYLWIVDPLDGTSNFIRQIPLFAVSIAVAKGNTLIAGAVYDPNRDEMFSAGKDEGAFLNGRPIRVSTVQDFSDAVISTSAPIANPRDRAFALGCLPGIIGACSSMRILNCASLCLAYVAAGRTEAHWEVGLHLWDMAAGALLIAEAGGVVNTLDGEDFGLFSTSIAACNGNAIKQSLFEKL